MAENNSSPLGDDFNPTAPETFTSAHETYKKLRQTCPVAHSNQWNGFYALMRYQDVFDVLMQPETYITSVQNVVPKVAFTGRRPPLHLDPPEHTPYRQAINRFFTPEKIKFLEPKIRTMVVDLLTPIIENGGGEFCAEFTHKLPGVVFAEFFNLSVELSMRIKEVTVIYDKALQEANDDLVKECSLELYKISQQIIDDRIATPMDPKDDLTCALLNTTYEGAPLPEAMILGTIRQMIVVGMIAPSVLLGSMVVHLAEHPELQQQLREDLTLAEAAVEEYVRLLAPYKGFSRTANKDVEINGTFIKKDEPIALVYASANRDETIFENPDEFILNRANINQHLGFGRGPHYCAGAPLARLMIQLTLEEILKRTKTIRVNGPIRMTRWPEWGTLEVPVAVTS